jgi:hypothetical protein
MNAMDVMVDLETMGLSYNSAIISIGAVKFNTLGIRSEFYNVIDLQSCVDAGLQVEANTILWWMRQSNEAREALTTKKALPLRSALLNFAAWLGDDPITWGNRTLLTDSESEPEDDSGLWGNGSDFDNVLLANAYKACKLVLPWKDKSNRCYRTIKKLFPEVEASPFSGIMHNALHDAQNQAMHLIEIMAYLKRIKSC